MSMCYDNHRIDLGKEMLSGLCLLADAASKLEEEEEQQEESKKRIFYLFPRKFRSSLMKGRHEKQYLSKASTTSSSSLLHLNILPYDSETENKQSPNSVEPIFNDEEQRRKKGKSKILCEDDDYEENEKRLFETKFVYRRYSEQRFDHLNGASTSSSFLDLRCSEPSLLFGSEKTETKDPPNPNYHSSSPSSCLTENTSRKRRAVSHKNSSVKLKKAMFSPLPKSVTETPEWVFQVMKYMNGDDDETPKLIFERTLSASDVNSQQSRLLIPFKKLIRNDFLTPVESRAIQDNGVGTILVNQIFKMWDLRFKVWAMKKKESGNGTLNYILNRGWNDVVKGNELKANNKISLWTFRCRGVLCFALDTE